MPFPPSPSPASSSLTGATNRNVALSRKRSRSRRAAAAAYLKLSPAFRRPPRQASPINLAAQSFPGFAVSRAMRSRNPTHQSSVFGSRSPAFAISWPLDPQRRNASPVELGAQHRQLAAKRRRARDPLLHLAPRIPP